MATGIWIPFWDHLWVVCDQLNSSFGIITLIGVLVVLPIICVLPMFLTFWYLSLYSLVFGLKDYENESLWNCVWGQVADLWMALAKIWHGWDVDGLEHIPDGKQDGALIVLYHGTSPIDFPYLTSKIFRAKHRMANIVAHRMSMKFPGAKRGLKALRIFAGPYDEFVRRLKEGHLVIVAPGGILEATFSDENYQILWNNRMGFAKGALEAKVPIIPAFTVNCNEAFRAHFFPTKNFSLYVYNKTGIPLMFPYGGLPVKMRTVLGEPIPYSPDLTPQQLAIKVQNRMKSLIDQHQRIPGSMIQGVLDRFRERRKQD